MFDNDEFWKRLAVRPKAELHLHLEGSLTLSTLAKIARQKNLPLPGPDFYRFSNFAEFDGCFKRLGPLLDRPADFGLAAESLGEHMGLQGVVYAEVFVMPLVHMIRGVGYQPMMEAILTGFDRAMAIGGPEVNVIASIPRNAGIEAGEATLKALKDYPIQRVIGLDLASVEEPGTIACFEQTFIKARDLGLFTVAHAGEFRDASVISKTLHILKPNRIGHGISAIEDLTVMNCLKNRRIPLEISVSSNVMLGAVKNMKSHPVRRLFEAGVPMVINTDDPAFFHTSLLEEYGLLADEFGFDESELCKLADDSIRWSFADDHKKKTWLG